MTGSCHPSLDMEVLLLALYYPSLIFKISISILNFHWSIILAEELYDSV